MINNKSEFFSSRPIASAFIVSKHFTFINIAVSAIVFTTKTKGFFLNFAVMPFELIPFVAQQFSALIWKLETDTENDLLYVETRNQQEHTVAFSAFDLKNEKANFIELETEEKWLTGMSGGRKQILFLHGYKSAQSPEHKSIIALDGLTGKQLWADYNLSVEAFTKDGLLAADQRFQSKRLVLLDYQNGTMKTGTNQMVLPDVPQEITWPEMLRLPPKNLFNIISATITGEISCLKYNSYLIISLHTLNKGNLMQELYVIENEKLVYRDLLNENIQKLQPEAFVLTKNHLVYIKNKTALKVLNL